MDKKVLVSHQRTTQDDGTYTHTSSFCFDVGQMRLLIRRRFSPSFPIYFSVSEVGGG